MNYKKITAHHFFMALLGMGLLVGCSGISAQTTEQPDLDQIEAIPPIVSATGKVIPAKWSRLSFSASGIIQEIVEEGNQVESGEVLALLDGEDDLQAAIAATEFELAAAQKAREDLITNANDMRTSALDRIALATKAVRDAQYQLDNFTVPQPQLKLSTSEGLDLMEKQLDEARAAFEPYKYYPSTDDTREDYKEALDEAQADFNSAVKRLQYETELDVAKANLSRAIDDLESWSNGPSPSELAVADARLKNGEAALRAARARLDDLELRAPFKGKVTDVNVRMGEWITIGQPILLIGDLDYLQIETTDLNEIDAARVKIGNPVRITFDALPGVEVNGIVEDIALKSSEGTGVNYTAVIGMEEVPNDLRWGMTAFVDIRVE